MVLKANINVKKTFEFKTQCIGVKSHNQNCTDHFGEDNSPRQNDLCRLAYAVLCDLTPLKRFFRLITIKYCY